MIKGITCRQNDEGALKSNKTGFLLSNCAKNQKTFKRIRQARSQTSRIWRDHEVSAYYSCRFSNPMYSLWQAVNPDSAVHAAATQS